MDKFGLVFDIVVFLENDLVFYCFDVIWVGYNGVFVVLLLCVLFNGLL